MNTYRPDKKILITSFSVLGVSLIFFGFFIFLLYSKISIVSQEISKISNASRDIDRVFLIKGELNNLKREISAIQSFFVNLGGEVEFIEKIEKMAREKNVAISVNNVSVDNKSQTNFTEILRLEIENEGRRDSLLNFASDLEKMPYSISLESIDFSSKGEGNKWTSKIILSVHKVKK